MSPRYFRTREEAKDWGRKMKEARIKKKLEKSSQSQIATSKVESINVSRLPEIPGKVWVQHNSGDKIAVPEWLAKDLEKEGKAKKI